MEKNMEMCPCGSQIAYNECCEPYITGKVPAPTAEKLMRARYTAYAKTAIDFIMSSTIEEKRKECDEKAIRNWSQLSTWHKLEIINVEKGGAEDSEGSVEFIAHFTEGGILKNYHEKGRFKKISDSWFYIDGEIQKQQPFIRSEDKISRNAICSCGSGKKYKKCCGK
jgi:SEC-C motif domain protein